MRFQKYPDTCGQGLKLGHFQNGKCFSDKNQVKKCNRGLENPFYYCFVESTQFELPTLNISQAMVQEIIKMFCNLINGVLRPNSIVSLKEPDRTRLGGWAKTDSLVTWLPTCGRQIR